MSSNMDELLRRALRDERGFGRKPLRMEEGTVEMIAEFAAGRDPYSMEAKN